MIDWDAIVLQPVMNVFGQPAVYFHEGVRLQLNGVFDRYHVVVVMDAQTGAPVSTMKPIFGVRSAEFPGDHEPQQGAEIEIDGVIWQVIDTQPDGHGHIKLILKHRR